MLNKLKEIFILLLKRAWYFLRRIYRSINIRQCVNYLRLRINKVQCRNSIFGSKYYISNNGKIIFGKNVLLNSYPNGSCHRTSLSTYLSYSIIQIGDNCKLNGTVLHCNEKITIGSNCMFGPGTIIVDNDSHRIVKNYLERIKSPISKPIIISDNVWVGMNCIILKGVTIGDNSIIAAGSIVTKDIPDNCVYGGNPAKLIKKLDS